MLKSHCFYGQEDGGALQGADPIMHLKCDFSILLSHFEWLSFQKIFSMYEANAEVCTK